MPDRPHAFVFVPDVGSVVATLIDTPAAYGKICNLAGAGVTTQRTLVAEMERETGRKIKLRVVGKTMLRSIGRSPMMREMVEMNDRMTDPVIMDDSALQRLIGPVHETPYAEGIRLVLAGAATTEGWRTRQALHDGRGRGRGSHRSTCRAERGTFLPEPSSSIAAPR